MSGSGTNYPRLYPEHLNNARLFADRNSMLEGLDLRKGGIVGEVGVGLGEFSNVLIQTLQPSQFVAFDMFDLHNIEMLWGRPTQQIFNGQTHREFYEKQMSRHWQVVVEEGPSTTGLRRYPDRYFDVLYIDADHAYDGVKQDTLLAVQKIKESGTVIFNDYILWDHVNGAAYGVVPAVNELVVESDWRVIGFALAHQMFCDIAVRRAN